MSKGCPNVSKIMAQMSPFRSIPLYSVRLLFYPSCFSFKIIRCNKNDVFDTPKIHEAPPRPSFDVNANKNQTKPMAPRSIAQKPSNVLKNTRLLKKFGLHQVLWTPCSYKYTAARVQEPLCASLGHDARLQFSIRVGPGSCPLTILWNMWNVMGAFCGKTIELFTWDKENQTDIFWRHQGASAPQVARPGLTENYTWCLKYV